MKPKIKICGITSLEDLRKAGDCRADYIGFVINYSKSPRNVGVDDVRAVVKAGKKEYPKIKFVGVFVDQDISYLKDIKAECDLDIIQLHGSESLEYCKEAANLSEIWKAVVINSKEDIKEAEKYRGAVSRVIFDAGRGSGKLIDFNLLDGVKVDILAGGLNPSNVKQVLSRLSPNILDVSSGVENAPGKKDFDLTKQFINQVNMKIFFKTKYDADKSGFFGDYGGQYVPELIKPALKELEKAYEEAKQDPEFEAELFDLFKNYSGRPTPLYFAKNLTKKLGGAKIYLKNEGLNHTGSHKINHCLGQALLARRMGKKRLVAETGAGQHGLATATVAAKFGFDCTVYMGEVDIKRQRPNVFWIERLGAEVIPVKHGTKRLKDAVMAALQDWIKNVEDSYYLLGSVVGPHPYPSMTKDFQSIVGLEVREQIKEQEGRLPDYLVACVGGGSNAIGLFNPFLEEDVKMVGVEAGGKGVENKGTHATRTHGKGSLGVVEGYKSFFLQNEDGQVEKTHSISAGLDYAGIGPQHAHLFDTRRVDYEYVTDSEVLEAFDVLAKTEGIFPALESAHALAQVIKMASNLDKDKIIVVNVSGRGDKDMFVVAEEFGDRELSHYLK